jgi:hypothetical protein
VINLGSISVGNATLVVANVLTCNNHSPIYLFTTAQAADSKCILWVEPTKTGVRAKELGCSAATTIKIKQAGAPLSPVAVEHATSHV